MEYRVDIYPEEAGPVAAHVAELLREHLGIDVVTYQDHSLLFEPGMRHCIIGQKIGGVLLLRLEYQLLVPPRSNRGIGDECVNLTRIKGLLLREQHVLVSQFENIELRGDRYRS